jgi:hypothetical protein
MAKPTDAPVQHAPDHIEQIRDIIFGPQKREYDQHFERLAGDLRKFQEQAQKHTDERCDALEQALHEITATLRKEAADVQHSFEGKITSANADFTSRLQKANEAVASLQRELAETRSKLQSEIRITKEQLTTQMEAQVTALKDSKVSRETMAELLQQLAMSLKGVEVLEELQRAVRRKTGE